MLKLWLRFAIDFFARLVILTLLFYSFLILVGGLTGCVSPRSSPIFSIPYDEQASKGIIRYHCNGIPEISQGIAVCEEKEPAKAVFTIKVPPLPGRVIFSNGLTKSVQDFNNYGEEGFWFWKKAKIEDTWISLDLKEFADFGDWPVVISTAAKSKEIGILQNSIVFYGRVCNDKTVPCLSLHTRFDCVGHMKTTSISKIGKCQRMAGSPQEIYVTIPSDANRAMLYFSMPQAGVLESREVIGKNDYAYTIQNIPVGPSLMGIRLSYYRGDELIQKEARILFIGVDPKWTGIDKPQIIRENNKARILRPFMADVIEASLYEGLKPLRKWISYDEKMTGVEWPLPDQRLCAFAYSRESSDVRYTCINSLGGEIDL